MRTSIHILSVHHAGAGLGFGTSVMVGPASRKRHSSGSSVLVFFMMAVISSSENISLWLSNRERQMLTYSEYMKYSFRCTCVPYPHH